MTISVSQPDDKLLKRSDSSDPRAVRTREKLLSATIKLLHEEYPENLSVSRLVRAAGVSRQVFYQHFSDRDALILEAGKEIFRAPYTRFAESFSVEGDHVDEMVALMDELKEHKSAVLSLMDSPVHGPLENYIYDLMLPPMRDEIRRFLDRRETPYDEEQLADITRFVAAGNHYILQDGVRRGASSIDIARRADKVHRALDLILPED